MGAKPLESEQVIIHIITVLLLVNYQYHDLFI